MAKPLRTRFRDAALDEMSRYSFTITPACENDLRDFIEKGVSKLNLMYPSNLPPEQIQGAEMKLRFFVREMITIAIANGDTTLQETTFRSIKSRLCPLHPFC